MQFLDADQNIKPASVADFVAMAGLIRRHASALASTPPGAAVANVTFLTMDDFAFNIHRSVTEALAAGSLSCEAVVAANGTVVPCQQQPAADITALLKAVKAAAGRQRRRASV